MNLYENIHQLYICLKIQRHSTSRKIGLSLFQRDTILLNSNSTLRCQFQLTDFIDNDQFSLLDSILIRYGGSNVVLFLEDGLDPMGNFDSSINHMLKSDMKKLNNIFQSKTNLELQYRKSSLFQIQEHLLLKLLDEASSSKLYSIAKDQPLAYQYTLNVIMQNLDLLAYDELYGTYGIFSSNMNSFMRLDSAAIQAVNLLPLASDTLSTNPNGSIFSVLNRCKTKMGSRLLERWLRQPLLDEDAINQRLDMVETLKEATILRNRLTDEILKSIPDIDTIMTKLHRPNASLAEVYRLYLFVRVIPRLYNLLNSLFNENQTNLDISFMKIKFLEPLEQIESKFSTFEKLVENVIDMNQLPDLIINAKYDNSLTELKEELDEINVEAQELYRMGKDKWGRGIDMKLEESPQYGLIFRSTRGDDEKQLRLNNSSIRILSILKNGVHFTIPALEKLASRRFDLYQTYKDKQSILVRKTIETTATYLPIAQVISNLVAELDVLNAFANIAALSMNSYCRPKILTIGSKTIQLKNARHPCVELMDNITFQANDYDFVPNKSTFQLITGPNMGGKSTYIRGIGCISVMAQIGCFVPCDEAVISIIDCILVRVGAGDAVSKGVSTFMAEMMETSIILETATTNSLIIIDELGRGTSTFDGYGIAYAICEYILSEIKCLTLFATHFHELTTLEQTHQECKNQHVTAIVKNNQLLMQYQIKQGPCLESFGVNVAVSAGFPISVINEAKRKAHELENHQSDYNDHTLKYMKRFSELCPSNHQQVVDFIDNLKSDSVR